MNKRDLDALEKVWIAEINDRLPFQSKAKIYQRLCDEELIQPMTITLPGRFAVVIKGYQLTHAGRFLYCSSCADPSESETDSPERK